MKFEIKNRWTSALIFECDADSMRLAVELAVSKKVSLAGADLAGADLADVNLADVNLAGANLAGANLAGAYLARANLAGAYLADADLARAYLADVNLARANLARAYLADVNLARADLAGAYLAGAYLAGADLADVNLAGANLAGADLADANLARAYAAPTDFEHLFQIPQEGEIIGWGKKAGKLVKMRVPPEAKRTGNIKNRKCRAEFVEVLWIEGNAPVVVKNEWAETLYAVGERVRPHEWCDNGFEDCRPGIHFFLTRKEAEMWV